jgi:hypothetical protein
VRQQFVFLFVLPLDISVVQLSVEGFEEVQQHETRGSAQRRVNIFSEGKVCERRVRQTKERGMKVIEELLENCTVE